MGGGADIRFKSMGVAETGDVDLSTERVDESNDESLMEPVDYRQEMLRMAREFELDEAKLVQIRDVPAPWSTVTGRPVGWTPVNPDRLPAWYPSSAR